MNLILRPDESDFKEFNKRIFGFDIETHTDKNHFLLCSLTFDEDNITFFHDDAIFELMNKRQFMKDRIGIATNLGFDFLGTFMQHKDYWKICEKKGHIYNFIWYSRKNKRFPIKFYDTINFFKASVEKLGKITNIPKLPHPKCFQRKPISQIELQELIKYCVNDAEISRIFFKDFIIKYINQQRLKLKTTIASTSLADYRRNYLDNIYKVESTEVHDKVFKAYYGGRTEVFKRGTFHNVNCYDINSLYPSQMIKEMPDPNSVQDLNSSNQYLIDNYDGVSYVEGYQEDTYLPILPVRYNQKLIFPTGLIKGYYTHYELRKAQNNGFNVKYIGDGVIYTKKCKPFERFIKAKYQKRKMQKEKGDPMELMTKLIMNSLYGKFAYNYKTKDSLIPVNELTEKEINDSSYIEDLGNGYVTLSSDTGQPCTYSFPIFSCYITAYARIKIWEEMQKVKDKLIYCDTDSMFLIDKKIKSSNELGEFKFEYNSKDAIFIKPKMYMTQEVKIKGVKKVNKEVFKQILKNPTITQERFVKYRTAIRSKDHHKHGKLKINQIIPITKTLDLEDSKRFWSNYFVPENEEDSKPIKLSVYDYEDDFKEIPKELSIENKTGEDTFDHMGNDITKEEFLNNEIFFETK